MRSECASGDSISRDQGTALDRSGADQSPTDAAHRKPPTHRGAVSSRLLVAETHDDEQHHDSVDTEGEETDNEGDEELLRTLVRKTRQETDQPGLELLDAWVRSGLRPEPVDLPRARQHEGHGHLVLHHRHVEALPGGTRVAQRVVRIEGIP